MITCNKINLKESSEILSFDSDILESNMCYNNIARLSQRYEDKYDICFGYWGTKDTIFLRHGYLINKNNEVVDPTILMLQKDSKALNAIYYTFARYSYYRYMNVVRKHFAKYEEILPDFAMYTKEAEKEFYNFAVNNNLVIWHDSYELYLKEFDAEKKLEVHYGYD